MRHTFSFPIEIREAVKDHVKDAVKRLRPEAYRQEPAYATALAGKLDAIVYDGPQGFVEFRATIVKDRGPDPAEHWSGIDFVITATIRNANIQIDKAIVFQAKKGFIEDLKQSERKRLLKQIHEMKRLTS